jgi:hypothetical protein
MFVVVCQEQLPSILSLFGKLNPWMKKLISAPVRAGIEYIYSILYQSVKELVHLSQLE